LRSCHIDPGKPGLDNIARDGKHAAAESGMGSILSRMRVAATLPMGGGDGLEKPRVHAKGL